MIFGHFRKKIFFYFFDENFQSPSARWDWKFSSNRWKIFFSENMIFERSVKNKFLNIFVVTSVTPLFSLSSCSLLIPFPLPSCSRPTPFLALCSRPYCPFSLSVPFARSAGRKSRILPRRSAKKTETIGCTARALHHTGAVDLHGILLLFALPSSVTALPPRSSSLPHICPFKASFCCYRSWGYLREGLPSLYSCVPHLVHRPGSGDLVEPVFGRVQLRCFRSWSAHFSSISLSSGFHSLFTLLSRSPFRGFASCFLIAR